MLTPERVEELSRLAFKLSGYDLKMQPDGQVGVKCAPRTALLMNTFKQLLCDELRTDPT